MHTVRSERLNSDPNASRLMHQRASSDADAASTFTPKKQNIPPDQAAASVSLSRAAQELIATVVAGGADPQHAREFNERIAGRADASSNTYNSYGKAIGRHQQSERARPMRARYGESEILASQIQGRELALVLPEGAATGAQQSVLSSVTQRANSLGVQLRLIFVGPNGVVP